MHHFHNADGRWRDLDGRRDCARREEASCARAAQGQSPTTQIKGGFIMTKSTIKHQKVVSEAEWLKARRKLLAKEKEFTRLRDKMTAQIRALPWRKIEKDYHFDCPKGKESLVDLFEGKTQLALYHFMLGPDWDQGCKSCSFFADSFQGIPIHLAHRDVAFVVVSRAPLSKIEQFEKRMGWNFKRSEEHTSELQSLTNLVCRLLLEKKKTYIVLSQLAGDSSQNGLTMES